MVMFFLFLHKYFLSSPESTCQSVNKDTTPLVSCWVNNKKSLLCFSRSRQTFIYEQIFTNLIKIKPFILWKNVIKPLAYFVYIHEPTKKSNFLP